MKKEATSFYVRREVKIAIDIADPSSMQDACHIREALSQVTHTATAYPGFCSIKRLGLFPPE